MALSPMWLAFRAVAEGLSANAGLRMAQEAGLAIRRQTWLRMFGEVKANYSGRIAELDRPLNARPRPSEMTRIDTKTQRGYVQYVDVYTRNLDTGEIRSRPMAIRGERLLSRDSAIARAVETYRTAVDRSKVTPAQWGTDPREVVEGGIYGFTHALVPSTEK